MFDDLTHCGADSRQLVFRSGCRSSLRPVLSIALGEAGFDRGGYRYRLVRRTVTFVHLLRDTVRQHIRSIESGWKFNFVERHGHKAMTVSNGFSFRAAKRGVRRLLARPASERGSVLYEFAMVVMVVSVMLIGIIYGGITFYDYETLANATSIGARTISINGKTTTQACSLGEQALLGAATNLNTSQITVTFPNTTTTGTYSAGNLSCTLSEGNTVSIQATYPCNMYFPKLGINLCNNQSTNPPTISAQAAVRVE